MTMIRLFLCALLATCAGTAGATQNDEDWNSFGRVLGLVQSVVRLAASNDDPKAVQRGVEGMLSGNNNDFNRLLADMFEDLPREHRSTLFSIGRDLAAIAARENAKAEIARSRTATAETALAARKELTQMGLRYHDPAQFLDAVKRDDLLAVELFVAGRGVNLESRDTAGDTAADIARRGNNRQMMQLLAAAGAK